MIERCFHHIMYALVRSRGEHGHVEAFTPLIPPLILPLPTLLLLNESGLIMFLQLGRGRERGGEGEGEGEGRERGGRGEGGRGAGEARGRGGRSKGEGREREDSGPWEMVHVVTYCSLSPKF